MKKDIMAKNEYIGFRTTTNVKKILQKLANEGYRTVSQQCDMIIVQWLKEHKHLKEKPKN